MKKVLVTGAAGYLGAHVCKAFKKDGWNVTGIGHNRRIKNSYIDEIIYFDIREHSCCLEAIQNYDVVVHLAGRIESGISFQEPTEFYSVNTGGTCNVLNAMWKNNLKNIIFSSTAAVYKAKNSPIKEIDEITNNSPYGYSKLCAERAIRASNLNFVIFRFFNLTGADPDGEMGEAHEPETHLIPRMIQNLNNFELYGKNYNTPDGTCIRDYVHVTDVANAHLAAANHLYNKGASITLNLGSGKGHSILEMLQELEKITGKKIEYTVKSRRQGDADSLVADTYLARKILRYETKHDIASILSTAYKWHTKGE
jgi:UDP-glucose-4-epimerase GalE